MTEQVSANRFIHPREVFKLEASGLRTSLATVLPLIIGQIAGFPAIGLSGLYLSVTDKAGATVFTLLAGLILERRDDVCGNSNRQ